MISEKVELMIREISLLVNVSVAPASQAEETADGQKDLLLLYSPRSFVR